MGGHGGLNILPQKRWNVYNADNREKVRRDEQAAAREEALRLDAERRKEADLRLQALRRNRGLAQPPSAPSAADAGEAGPGTDVSDEEEGDELGGHINLLGSRPDFASLASEKVRKSNPNPKDDAPKKRLKEEPRVVGPEDEKYRLGYGVAGKGVSEPWYMARPPHLSSASGPSGTDEVRNSDEASGSGGGMRKKTIEELREERLQRERRERTRQKAVLATAAAAKRKQPELRHGFSTRELPNSRSDSLKNYGRR